jgi:hypothetical protein
MSGDFLGEIAAQLYKNQQLHPAIPAALAGFASHALLDRVDADYTPDWTAWVDNPDALKADLPYIAAQLVGAASEVYSLTQEDDPTTRWARVAGVVGAVLPDIIDGIYSVVNPEAWKKGDLLLPFHDADDSEKEPQTREEAVDRAVKMTLLRLAF